jgi:succinoglycan biosynthesis protein ExoO
MGKQLADAEAMTDVEAQSVSVIVPAFNAEPFIARAIRSALDQTLPPREVIVVDDGSSDGTCEVVKALAVRDARVRLVKLSRNGGPSVARNAAFAAAQGNWIAVLDADDAYVPSRLQTLVAVGEAFGADIVADNIALYDIRARQIVSLGVSSSSSTHIVGRHDYVRRCRGNREDVDWGLLHPMFRRTFIQQHALEYPQDLRHGEDFVFMLWALLAGAKFVFTPEMGYLYTQRWGSYSKMSSGASRTQVDFKTMTAHTLLLMKDQRVRADRAMHRLLRRRYRALRAIDVQYRMPAHLRERDFSNVARLLAYDARAWLVLMKTIGARASSFVGARSGLRG